MLGRDTYDRHCVFGNIVNMDHKQVDFLRDFVAKYKTSIPMYVCTIKDSHVKKKEGKMVNISPFCLSYVCTLSPYLTEPFMFAHSKNYVCVFSTLTGNSQ